MERREFLKKSLSIGLGAGVLLLPKGLRSGASLALAGGLPDLAILNGSSAEVMFDRGIAALGGIGRFVKPGQTVLIKPNMSWAVKGGAANTSPALVARVIERCLDAGAKRVYVMDHSIDHWESALETSGVGAALKSAGGVYVPADDVKYYQRVELSGAAFKLKTAHVHESLLESDVLIDLPVLKHHVGTGVSAAIKNLMGCVWDRREYHAKGLHECAADFLRVRKPDLCVVDAYRVITKYGPRGGLAGGVTEMKAQIISADAVAADAAGAKMLGREPSDIGHIRLAAEAGLGQIDLTKLKIERIDE